MSLPAKLQACITGMGWKKKIYLFSGLMIATAVSVGLVGALAIAYFNFSLQKAVGDARERAEVAALANLSVVSIGRAQASLIAAQSQEDLRTQAIASIRAATILDECLQTLDKTLPGDPKVAQLIKLNLEVRSPRMVIIKAAKSHNTAAAADQARAIAASIASIEELSGQIMAEQQALLTACVTQMVKIGNHALLILGLCMAFGVTVSGIACVIFARMLAKSIGDVRRGEETLTGNAAQVATIAKDITQCDARFGAAVEQISAGVQNVHAATEKSGDQLSSATSSIEQMAVSVSDNAASIGQVAQRFGLMNSDMQSAIGITEALKQSVGKIDDISDNIDQISRQTNMLAINAAIEAARAGETGRGFAVVAAEVRMLAQRSGEATKQIHVIAAGIANEVATALATLNKSASNANDFAGQLRLVMKESEAASANCNAIRDVMDGVSAQMAVQRVAVSAIGHQITEVQQTSDLSAAQALALGGVSRALTDSANNMGTLAENLRL